MFFKRKTKKVNTTCFHEYKIVDLISYVDFSLDYEMYYEIGCLKCGTKRTVDEYDFSEMRKIGLIREAADE